jgi:hypothetical protein
MSSISGELDALDAAVDAVRSADLDGLNPAERFRVLERFIQQDLRRLRPLGRLQPARQTGLR